LNQILSLVSNDELNDENKTFEVIVDTGCTNSTSPFIEDFEPNSLKKLDKALIIEGVGGNIKVEKYGKLRWEHVKQNGEIIDLAHEGFYAPELSETRLFSPQR